MASDIWLMAGAAPLRPMASSYMRPLIVIFLLVLSGKPAAAQVFLGAEAGPDSFFKSEEAKLDALSDDAFAWALSARISSTTLYSVFESTAAEKEILKHLRSGLYRQELITLILISEKTAVPFLKLAPEQALEGSLRSLAKKHGANLPALFLEAADIKAAADAQTPLFIGPSVVVMSESSGAFTAEISTVADGAIGPRQARVTVADGAIGPRQARVTVADSPPKAEQASVTVPAGASEAEITLPDGFKVKARLALTPGEHSKGLMFVTDLPQNTGMLFVFAEDGVKYFWMKNTFIDLDMIFLSGEMKAGRIFHRVPRSFAGQPQSKVARAGAPARFVLELAGGTARDHGLKPGSKLEISFNKRKKADTVYSSSAPAR